MKEYVKPSVKLKTLAGNESLLDGSITEGVISNDTPGEGTPENPTKSEISLGRLRF